MKTKKESKKKKNRHHLFKTQKRETKRGKISRKVSNNQETDNTEFFG